MKCIDDPVAIYQIEMALELTNEWTLDDREEAIWDYMEYRRDHLAVQLEGAEETPEPVEQIQVNSIMLLNRQSHC